MADRSDSETWSPRRGRFVYLDADRRPPSTIILDVGAYRYRDIPNLIDKVWRAPVSADDEPLA